MQDGVPAPQLGHWRWPRVPDNRQKQQAALGRTGGGRTLILSRLRQLLWLAMNSAKSRSMYSMTRKRRLLSQMTSFNLRAATPGAARPACRAAGAWPGCAVLTRHRAGLHAAAGGRSTASAPCASRAQSQPQVLSGPQVGVLQPPTTAPPLLVQAQSVRKASMRRAGRTPDYVGVLQLLQQGYLPDDAPRHALLSLIVQSQLLESDRLSRQSVSRLHAVAAALSATCRPAWPAACRCMAARPAPCDLSWAPKRGIDEAASEKVRCTSLSCRPAAAAGAVRPAHSAQAASCARAARRGVGACLVDHGKGPAALALQAVKKEGAEAARDRPGVDWPGEGRACPAKVLHHLCQPARVWALPQAAADQGGQHPARRPRGSGSGAAAGRQQRAPCAALLEGGSAQLSPAVRQVGGP